MTKTIIQQENVTHPLRSVSCFYPFIGVACELPVNNRHGIGVPDNEGA